MKYELEDIKMALRRELAESFPNKWRDKYYIVVGYLESAIKRIKVQE